MVDAGQPFPSINSLSDVVTQNSDGSFDLYFAPELPEDVPEGNWIKTNPARGSPRHGPSVRRHHAVLRPNLDPRRRDQDQLTSASQVSRPGRRARPQQRGGACSAIGQHWTAGPAYGSEVGIEYSNDLAGCRVRVGPWSSRHGCWDQFGDNRVDNYIHADIHVPSPRSVLDLEAHRPCFGTKRSNRQLVAAQLPPIRHDTVVTRSARGVLLAVADQCHCVFVTMAKIDQRNLLACVEIRQHGRAGWS